MVDLSIRPNWARSSSSQRSMAYTNIIFGKLHEYSGPTDGSSLYIQDPDGNTVELKGPPDG